jgi:hypothetical protein
MLFTERKNIITYLTPADQVIDFEEDELGSWYMEGGYRFSEEIRKKLKSKKDN